MTAEISSQIPQRPGYYLIPAFAKECLASQFRREPRHPRAETASQRDFRHTLSRQPLFRSHQQSTAHAAALEFGTYRNGIDPAQVRRCDRGRIGNPAGQDETRRPISKHRQPAFPLDSDDPLQIVLTRAGADGEILAAGQVPHFREGPRVCQPQGPQQGYHQALVPRQCNTDETGNSRILPRWRAQSLGNRRPGKPGRLQETAATASRNACTARSLRAPQRRTCTASPYRFRAASTVKHRKHLATDGVNSRSVGRYPRQHIRQHIPCMEVGFLLFIRNFITTV